MGHRQFTLGSESPVSDAWNKTGSSASVATQYRGDDRRPRAPTYYLSSSLTSWARFSGWKGRVKTTLILPSWSMR